MNYTLLTEVVYMLFYVWLVCSHHFLLVFGRCYRVPFSIPACDTLSFFLSSVLSLTLLTQPFQGTPVSPVRGQLGIHEYPLCIKQNKKTKETKPISGPISTKCKRTNLQHTDVTSFTSVPKPQPALMDSTPPALDLLPV